MPTFTDLHRSIFAVYRAFAKRNGGRDYEARQFTYDEFAQRYGDNWVAANSKNIKDALDNIEKELEEQP